MTRSPNFNPFLAMSLFLIFTIFVGLPLLIMEFTVGIMGRTYTTRIYSKLTGKKWLNIIISIPYYAYLI